MNSIKHLDPPLLFSPSYEGVKKNYKNNTKQGKYFSVDKILNEHTIKIVKYRKITLHKEKYGITTGMIVECMKSRRKNLRDSHSISMEMESHKKNTCNT